MLNSNFYHCEFNNYAEMTFDIHLTLDWITRTVHINTDLLIHLGYIRSLRLCN